jgi:hypothetical protein
MPVSKVLLAPPMQTLTVVIVTSLAALAWNSIAAWEFGVNMFIV